MKVGTWNGCSLHIAALSALALPACVERIEQVAVEDQSLTYTLSCQAPGTGFGAFALPPGAGGVLPFTPFTSLRAVANPVVPLDPVSGAPIVRGDLVDYIADLGSAIQLGKALFWDMQVGSDGKVACATCHFQAGADVRIRNQLHPGGNGAWDGQGTNQVLTAADFPFTDPVLGKDLDNIVGSQGIRRSTFAGITGTGAELTTAVRDPVFGTMRQSTALNAPTVINAVFNHRNFFNGRAQPEFNGVSPWGNRDSARAWVIIDTAGNIGQIDLHIQTASLASQAVGPPLNPVEMSAGGRSFPDIGLKLLLVKPLGQQRVDSRDSVLGGLADPRTSGLRTTYTDLIQRAFQPRWWNSQNTVTVNAKPYSLMQANFSLFFGLSIMLYEATLVADASPMDLYAASRTFDAAGHLVSDNPALLDPVVNRLAAQGITIPLVSGGKRAVTRADILTGLDLFEKPIPLPGTPGIPAGFGVGCSLCHVSAETTSASIRNLTIGAELGDVAFKNAGFDLRMERMFMGVRTPPPELPQPPPPVPLGSDILTFNTASFAVTVTDIDRTPVAPQVVPVMTYDAGWYNIGVRPASEGVGIGGLDAFGLPLSWTQYYQATRSNPSSIKVPGGGLGCVDASGNPVSPPTAPLTSPFAGEVLNPASGKPLLSGGLLKTEPSDAAGSFKTASLRNLDLSGPYLHAGGKSTLRQVVEFYDEGGDFEGTTVSPLIRPLGLTEDQSVGLVAFLVSLTDDRVLYQRAPFDHPELPVPAGQDAGGADLVTVIPAVGAAGQATPLPRFLDLNPFQP